MPTFSRTIARTALTFGTSLALAAGVAACDFGREPQRSETGGEIDDSFEPTKV